MNVAGEVTEIDGVECRKPKEEARKRGNRRFVDNGEGGMKSVGDGEESYMALLIFLFGLSW